MELAESQKGQVRGLGVPEPDVFKENRWGAFLVTPTNSAGATAKSSRVSCAYLPDWEEREERLKEATRIQ